MNVITCTLTFFIMLLSYLEEHIALNVIKLGVLLPVNGTYPFQMQKTVPALQLAVERGLLPDYKMVLVLRDSQCSETEAPLAAIDLYSKKQAHVFFGPVCDYAVAPVSRFSSRWGIPVLTAGALVTAFSDKSEYKLLTRLQGSYTKLAEFFIQVLEELEWKHVGLIYSDYKSQSKKGKSNCFFTMEAIYTAITRNHNIKPWHISVDISQPNFNVKEVFDQAKNEARVLVLCSDPYYIREFLLHAQDNTVDGEYAFIDINMFYTDVGADRPWYRKEDPPVRNQRAKKAYESLIIVTGQSLSTTAYSKFSDDVKKKAMEMYPDFKYEDKVNSFVGAFHDAAILYTLALKETLDAGGNITDGFEVTRRMWNRTFQGVSGTVRIDENGDRDMDFSLLDMNPNNGKFEVVANYFGNKKRYEPVPGKSIHWPGGRTSPPPDIPSCGFDGSKCPPVEPFPKYGIVLIVLGSLLLLAVTVVFLLYRWKFSNYYTMRSTV